MSVAASNDSRTVVYSPMRCHATYRAKLTRASSEPCNRFLGYVPGRLEFVDVAARAPDEPDGRIWVRCPRSDCHAWNIFETVQP